jgi:hypothetical protein
LVALREELGATRDGLKEEFAAVERELVKSLKDQGATSIQPDAYIKLTQRKAALESEIADLSKKTSKQQSKNTDLAKGRGRTQRGVARGIQARIGSFGSHQCRAAMMLFILSQKENDLLLIDQPEDDLDSQTVYEEVVKLLRSVKLNQQFIFATHDANFPVLGDAETVTSCAAEDEIMAVETGTIDSKTCQEKIVRIMEGGPEAFERRKTIYQIWKAG